MARVFVGYNTYGIEGVDNDFIHFIFDMALSHAASPSDYEMGLIITSDEHIQGLNYQYRGKNQSTNILSFPDKDIKDLSFIDDPNNYLGDIYISFEHLNREANKLNISSKERFAQLFVHGILHLVGFDHQDGQDARVMENMESRIMQAVL